MLKGAIFDFDGTLFNSMFIWDTAGEVYLRSIGIEPRGDLQKVLKPMSLLQSATYIREKYVIPLTVEEIMDGINRTVEDFYFHTVQSKEGVITFLEQMKAQGIKMCIATATDRYQVEAALKRCGMESFFSEVPMWDTARTSLLFSKRRWSTLGQQKQTRLFLRMLITLPKQQRKMVL